MTGGELERRIAEVQETVKEAREQLEKCQALYHQALETYVRAVVQRDLLFVETGVKRVLEGAN